jgi:hypothetical protein
MTNRDEPLLDARRRELAVAASIQVATCTGWTAPIDGTPASAHQARNCGFPSTCVFVPALAVVLE